MKFPGVRHARSGFSILELLIVTVILGILVKIAIPKFSGTKDKAKLAAVKADVRNAEVAQEAYFTDYKTYGTLAQLKTANKFMLSTGNTIAIATAATGYTLTVTNTSISGTIKSCKVRVGGGGTTVDSKITCP